MCQTKKNLRHIFSNAHIDNAKANERLTQFLEGEYHPDDNFELNPSYWHLNLLLLKQTAHFSDASCLHDDERRMNQINTKFSVEQSPLMMSVRSATLMCYQFLTLLYFALCNRIDDG